MADLGAACIADITRKRQRLKTNTVALVVPLEPLSPDFEGIESRNELIGTLEWCAPEILRGDDNYTNKIDVYSYGKNFHIEFCHRNIYLSTFLAF